MKQSYPKTRLRSNAKTPEEARMRRNIKRPSRAKAAKAQREQLKRAEKDLEEQKLRGIFEVELTEEEKAFIMQAYRCGLAKGRRKRSNKPNQRRKFNPDADVACAKTSCEGKTDDEVVDSSSSTLSTSTEYQDLHGSCPLQAQHSSTLLSSDETNGSHDLQWKFGEEKYAQNKEYTDVDDYKILDIDMPEAHKMLADDHDNIDSAPGHVSGFRGYSFPISDPEIHCPYPYQMMP